MKRRGSLRLGTRRAVNVTMMFWSFIGMGILITCAISRCHMLFAFVLTLGGELKGALARQQSIDANQYRIEAEVAETNSQSRTMFTASKMVSHSLGVFTQTQAVQVTTFESTTTRDQLLARRMRL